jgi:hypothetical protein
LVQKYEYDTLTAMTRTRKKVEVFFAVNDTGIRNGPPLHCIRRWLLTSDIADTDPSFTELINTNASKNSEVLFLKSNRSFRPLLHRAQREVSLCLVKYRTILFRK